MLIASQVKSDVMRASSMKMKPLLAFLIICGVGLSVCAQQQGRVKTKNGKRSLANRPPIVKSFVPSGSSITIPCPRWIRGAYAFDKVVIDLSTEAFDPDLNKLSYQYFVSAGKITGRGSKVSWELTGVEPGNYVVKVNVKDGHGADAWASSSVSVLTLIHCPGPCASVSISCPDEVAEGKSINCTATLSRGEPTVNPVYEWLVSAGTITKGQGTSNIEVDITGVEDQKVLATLEVGGYPPECQHRFTREVQIRRPN